MRSSADKSASQQLPQGRAFDELHHDEELAVEFPDVVNGDDPGVVQSRRRSCFVLETPNGAGVGQRFDAEDFDGDVRRSRRRFRSPVRWPMRSRKHTKPASSIVI
jgi:hypothetical protein